MIGVFKNNIKLFFVFIFVALLYILFILRGDFAGDFWEHGAVVYKFANGINNHPLLLSPAPHSFYNPYLIFLGYIAKFTGLPVITTLCLAGIFNLCFLFFAISKFLESFSFSKNAIFLTFIFTLILWRSPYDHSGFISLNIINYTLPYPSTFCLALSFFLLYRFNIKNKETLLFYILLSVGIACTILTHLITGICLLVGLLSISMVKYKFTNFKGWLFIGLATASSIGIAFCWPLYSLMDLINGAGKVYNASNEKMYINVFERTLPAIYILFFAIIFLFAVKNKSLLIMIFLLCILYALGYYTQQWSYGRTLPIIMLLLHANLGKASAIILDYFKDSVLMSAILWGSLIIVIFSYTKRTESINPKLFENERSIATSKYAFLNDHTNKGDVILSDLGTSWPIPAFGRKIVACEHVQAFIPDDEKRRLDVNRFFGKEFMNENERITIIKKYAVDYILIKLMNEPDEQLKNFLKNHAKAVFSNIEFCLYKFPGS